MSPWRPAESFDSFIGIEDGGLTMVTLGRAPGMPSSASHAPVSASGKTRRGAGSVQEFRARKRVAIEGWVYVRLNRMEDSDGDGTP